jgi:hypothetical protein
MSRPGVAAIARVLLAAGGAGAVLAAATATDRSVTIGSAPSAVASTRVALTDTLLTCPGPELTGVAGVDDVTTQPLLTADTAPASVVAAAGITVGVNSGGAPRLRIGPLTQVEVATAPGATGPGVTSTGVTSPAASGALQWRSTDPGPLAVAGTGARAVGVVGAQESLVTDAAARKHGVRGLISTSCGDPTADAWLVGGGGGAGRQERLLLVNPGANPATVEVTMHGVGGPVQAAGGNIVTVPARGRTALLLDGLAPEEAAPAVHVGARSGLVGVTLIDTWVDGVTPRGLDATGATALPAVRQVIPAVAGPGAGAVRVVSTGTTDAVAQVRLITRTGRTALAGGSGVVRVPAGAIRDVPIATLPTDIVGIEVVADQPVVAAATSTRSTAKGGISDFAWSPAVPALRTSAGTTFAPLALGDASATRTLSLLASGGAAEADVTLVDKSGVATSEHLRLAQDSSTTLDVSTIASVWVTPSTGGGQLRAAVVTTVGSGGDAVITVRPLVGARFAGRDLSVEQVRQ